MLFFVLVSTLISFTQVKNENYKKCISESTQSNYCEQVIAFVESAKNKKQNGPY